MANAASGTPATAALTQAGIAFTIHEYAHDPRVRGYGTEAASALGLDPDCVFKTLLATAGGGPVVAIVPVSAMLDLKALAAACGVRRAELMDAAQAERLTGYVVGGISPIGQRRTLDTWIDETAILFPVVYVSGGRRGLDIGLAPDDLAAATGGAFAAIARADRP